ncbi:hypothetical protein BH23GEM4_BH23GEM4_11470 [soil metagenome]
MKPISNSFSAVSRLFVLPALLACAACASAGSTRTSLLSANWTPPSGQRCEVDDTPVVLPTTDALVDSAAVANALPDAPSNGYAIVELRFDTLTAEAETRIVESDIGDAQLASVLRAVSSNLRRQRPLRDLPGDSLEQWRAFVGTLLLRVGLDDGVSLDVGRSEECRPRLTNGPLLQGTISTLWGEVVRINPGLAQPRTTVLKMQLSPTGQVTAASVVKSSGDIRADNVALRVGTIAAFQPALINRKASAVEVTFPVRLELDPGSIRRGRPRR